MMWQAEILKQPPMIAPARQYVWPMQIAGEEDALARGALLLMVRVQGEGAYLVTCALGFRDPSMPTGVFRSPNEAEICAVAGGYAYIADVRTPERCALIPLKPVAQVLEAPVVNGTGLLVFVGFHTMLAWGKDGLAWQTARLSWEGIRVTAVEEGEVRGFGWDLRGDVEVEFRVDLRTGEHTGGGYRV